MRLNRLTKALVLVTLLVQVASVSAQQIIGYGRTVTVRATSTTGTGHGKFGVIQRYDINNNQPSLFGIIHTTANARCANISPDGNRVAFLRNDNKICIRNMDGTGTEQVLGSIMDAATGWIDWPMNDWIYVSPNFGRNGLKRINTATGAVQDLGDLGVNSTWTLSVSADGTRACISANHNGWTSHIVEISASGITSVRNVGACGGSISPDGSLFTLNVGDHVTCDVKQFSNQSGHKTWTTARRSTAGGNWNRHRWSSNSNDWVTYTQGTPYQMESFHNQVLYYVPDAGQTSIQVTANGNGVYNEGDDLWIRHQNTPALNISPSSLSFTATIGGSAPAAKSVSITNSGTGTLPTLSVSSSAGWLQPALSGGANSWTVSNSVNLDGLAGGVHNATVMVRGQGIEQTSYTAQLTLIAPPVLTTISVTPSSVAPGATVQCAAAALDQFDKALAPQPAFTWSVVSGGGTISPAGLYTAPQNQGRATVRAAAGGIQADAEITIATAPAIYLKIDCTPQPATGWLGESTYRLEGGELAPGFSFGETVDISQVQDAAPAAVYLTASLSSTRNRYSFPTLPNGVYKVRLHFMLGSAHTGTFRMDWTIEETAVLSDFDVKTDAGGYDKGVVKEYSVTVADGNGLQISGVNDGGVSVFVCGIEVISAGATPGPAVTILSPKGGERYAVGSTMNVSWRCDTTKVLGVVVELSVDGGESWVVISGTTSIGGHAPGSTIGTFDWVVPSSIRGAQILSTDCLVRVSDYMETSLTDMSAAPFTIDTQGTSVVTRSPGAAGSVGKLVRSYTLSGALVPIGAHRGAAAQGVRIIENSDGAKRVVVRTYR